MNVLINKMLYWNADLIEILILRFVIPNRSVSNSVAKHWLGTTACFVNSGGILAIIISLANRNLGK